MPKGDPSPHPAPEGALAQPPCERNTFYCLHLLSWPLGHHLKFLTNSLGRNVDQLISQELLLSGELLTHSTDWYSDAAPSVNHSVTPLRDNWTPPTDSGSLHHLDKGKQTFFRLKTIAWNVEVRNLMPASLHSGTWMKDELIALPYVSWHYQLLLCRLLESTVSSFVFINFSSDE